MTTLTSLARAEALRAGRAQRITTVRHAHLNERPLVFVPLAAAGEANAPLAALVGDDRDAPRLLVVRQPRNRTERFRFAAELAAVLLPAIERCRRRVEPVAADRGRSVRMRCMEAPQLLVPNPAGVHFVRLLGRSTRFRRTYGEYAVDRKVPLLGRWLTFFAERSEHPGSCLLLPATGILTAHWATGQSPTEDLNLAATLGWIDPPPGRSGAQAAQEAEDPLCWPPAGPTTDPSFDNEVLARLVAGYDEADDAERTRIGLDLDTALTGQMRPTWDLVWRALDLVRALPAGARVAARWDADRDAFSGYAEQLDNGAPPQPRHDGAVAAAQRLNWLERAQASYDVQRAFDDPLVMAEYRLTGEAFAGTVVAAAPERVDSSGARRRLRPHITVSTMDPVRLDDGAELTSPSRPGQIGTVVSIVDSGRSVEVTLELSGGMGRSLKPTPGSVPGVGERTCYTTLTESFQPSGTFPDRDHTPWTHGGPPPPFDPADHDATEDWS